jgi:hypothetical protein
MKKNDLVSMVYSRIAGAVNRLEERLNYGVLDGPAPSDIMEDCAVRIVEDVFSGKISAGSDLVSRYYEMDPETEDVLHNGTLVIDGMKVLIEAVDLKVDIAEDMTEFANHTARKTNRWATVTESKIVDYKDGPHLAFVGVYDDGVKRKISYPVDYAWFVKKDSIPRIDTLMNLEGMLLEEAPTAKMVAFLKDRMKVAMYFDAKQLKIQTGIDGDVIPLEEYLIDEGVGGEENQGE